MRAAWITLSLVLVAAAATRAAAAGPSDVCLACHVSEPTLAANGGHAPGIDCVTCHDDRRPGRVGRRHRKIPTDCTSHHTPSAATHPVPPNELGPARLRRACLRCHDPHGSSNAHLIRTAILARGKFRPIDFHAAGGAVPGGFVDPEMPGRGLCEVCHRNTRFYLANGRGEPHFRDDCSICHDHAAAFGPVVTDVSCPICHPGETSLMEKDNLHHQKFAGQCSACHAEAKPEPGPGHRAISPCIACHNPAVVTTHVPPGMPLPCTQCHEPHGTDNIRLVRDVIHTPAGQDRPIDFDNLTGFADGSFASPSLPGTGLCEVCHTQTQFYRADGTGAPHPTLQCITCHRHEAGFSPQ